MNDPQTEYRNLREARREKCDAWEHADYLLDKAHEALDLAREAAKKHLDANRAVDELERIREDALVEYSAARRAWTVATEQFREALEKQGEQ